ncbi:helix-turn-helix domain-containing protein [Staphylococcus caeli]|uniref:helix-turn-helix domain-containing protein n=1 Tax=Staphylococcus caeli TaxID=2201815 RepID=UPI003F54480E
MYNIIQFAYTKAHTYKTEKSIFNIITGKKSHQTFFDACSQQLMSLYHSIPQLKYPSFERYSNNMDSKTEGNQSNLIISHPRHTYDSLANTFNAIQLLTQTLSNIQHGVHQFVPVTQSNTIQKRVKVLYQYILSEGLQETFINELTSLFELLSKQNDNVYLHYYLQGFEESMYTRQQVSLIESLPLTELYELELRDLVTLMNAIEDAQSFPILNKLIILPTLLNKTEQTLNGIKQGMDFEHLALQQNVKQNTIEDHILELFIKGYLTNYEDYLSNTNYIDFLNYYIDNRSERLRNYKDKFSDFSYFEIKLMIVGLERGDLHVTR